MKTIQSDLSLEQHRLRLLLGGIEDDDAANLMQAEQSKSISILSPQLNDNITLFYTRYAVTMQAVYGILQGSSTPSCQVTVKHASSRAAAGTAVVNGQTVSSTTTADNLTMADTTIPAGSWVWLNVDAVSGTVVELHLTLAFRVDPV